MTESLFENSYSKNAGGAIYAIDSSVLINATTFKSISSFTQGGVLFFNLSDLMRGKMNGVFRPPAL